MASIRIFIDLNDNTEVTVSRNTFGKSAQQLLDEAYHEAHKIVMLATQELAEPVVAEPVFGAAEKRVNPVSLVGL